MMVVYGVEITEEQIAAAKSAMRGKFLMLDVKRALGQAGVLDDLVRARATDRLLQLERKAGRIRVNPNNKREWLAA